MPYAKTSPPTVLYRTPARKHPSARRTPPKIATFFGPALSCHLPATIIPTAKKKNEAISGYPACLTVNPTSFISGPRNTE